MQQIEAADAVRKAARSAGFESREIFTLDSHFQWGELLAAADSLSIFSDKKIIELRMPTGKPGVEGSKALLSYCENLPEDTLMIMTSGKLESSALKAKWFQALDRAGVVIQVWQLTGTVLIHWLQARMLAKGIVADQEGIRALAARVEGNMLAAAQEIEKLYVLYGGAKVSAKDIQNEVADSSRFDVFNLCDCVLAGKTGRILRVLKGLQSEGVAAPIVLWALAREIRVLGRLKTAVNNGRPLDRALVDQRILDRRKSLISQCLNRLSMTQLEHALQLCARADRQIKGAQPGDPWEMLLSIALAMAGIEFMAETD